MESYIRPGDPARVVHELDVAAARVVDIRDEALCSAPGILRPDSDTPWQPQMAAGERPRTWNVSDRVRQSGADGLIYTARTDPARWHLVLFRWNDLGGPAVHLRTRAGSP